MANAAEQVVVELKAEIRDLKKGLIEASSSIKGFTDQAKKETAGVNQTFADMGAGVKSFLVTLGGLTGATMLVRSSIAAWNAQEKAIVSLNATLISTGQYTDAYSKELQDLSSELMNLTTHGDEAILNVTKQLVAFGAAPDQIEPFTKAVLDLSVGMGKDLNGAALLMGRALAGEFGMLSRFGIVVDENATKAEKLAQALDQINTRFGGQAAAQARTFGGQMTQLRNIFGDLLEEVGRIIAGALNFQKSGLVQYLIDLTNHLKNLTSEDKAVRSLAKAFSSLIDSVLDLLKAITDVVGIIPDIVGGLDDAAESSDKADESLKRLRRTLRIIEGAILGWATFLSAVASAPSILAISMHGVVGFAALAMEKLFDVMTAGLRKVRDISNSLNVKLHNSPLFGSESVLTRASDALTKFFTETTSQASGASIAMERYQSSVVNAMNAHMGPINRTKALLDRLAFGTPPDATEDPSTTGTETGTDRPNRPGVTDRPTAEASEAADRYAQALAKLVEQSARASEASGSLEERLAGVAQGFRDSIGEIQTAIRSQALRLSGEETAALVLEARAAAERAKDEVARAFQSAIDDAGKARAEIEAEIKKIEAALKDESQVKPEDRPQLEANLAEARARLERSTENELVLTRDKNARQILLEQNLQQALTAISQKATAERIREGFDAAATESDAMLAAQRRRIEEARRGAVSDPETLIGGRSREVMILEEELSLEKSIIEAIREKIAQREAARTATLDEPGRLGLETATPGLNPEEVTRLNDEIATLNQDLQDRMTAQSVKHAELNTEIARRSSEEQLRQVEDSFKEQIAAARVHNRIREALGLEVSETLLDIERDRLEQQIAIWETEAEAAGILAEAKEEIDGRIKANRDALAADDEAVAEANLEKTLTLYSEIGQAITDIFTVQYATIKDGAIQLLDPIEQITNSVKSLFVNTLNQMVANIVQSVFTAKLQTVLASLTMGTALQGVGLAGVIAAGQIKIAFTAVVTTIKALLPQLLIMTAIFTAVSRIFSFFRRPKTIEGPRTTTVTGTGPTYEDLEPKAPTKVSDLARQAGATIQQFYINFENRFTGAISAATVADLPAQIIEALDEAMPTMENRIKKAFRDDLTLEDATLSLA